jgi:prephenate dehydrogenase
MERRSAVGIAGYGRFGRALATLLQEAGMPVAVHDPAAEVPAGIAVRDLEQLAARAGVVFLAVPVPETGPVLARLRPHLASEHLVLDVGSVKQAPVAALQAALGEDVPWAGTHPLFGPLNIARGERPLRAVVCPNPFHPHAADRASALYERIGCEVIRQDPEEHDRIMARTHALAFFVAKGLIDIGSGDDLPFAPPSFQALAQTIGTVRGDAAHLFTAIETANPHAAGARRELLDALARVHENLEDLEDLHDPAAPMTIPDPERAPELRATRDLIDELDAEIVALLARRTHLAARARLIKAGQGAGIRDPQRESDLLAERRRWAAELGLPEDAVAGVFAAVLRFSREVQARGG